MQDDTQKKASAIHISKDDFEETLKKAGDKPVLVDFYADWCGPCKLAAPVIDKLSGVYSASAILTKLNVDENRELAQEHGVMSIPTVIIFKNGEEIDRKIGFPGEAGYKQMLDQALEDTKSAKAA